MAPWLLLTASLALAAMPQLSNEKAASAWQKASVAPRPTVPSIVGLTPEEAALALRRRDLREMPMGNETTSAQPPGRVARQLPPAGDPIPPERTVRFWLAEPPREIQVPNVVGSGLEDGMSVLSKAGLRGRLAGEEVSDERRGAICRQDPPATVPVSAGTPVHVWVSAGSPPQPVAEVPVPDVVGLPIRQAEIVLRQARFGCDVAGREPSRESGGTVARQDPPGRTPAPRGSRVRLWLAVSPPPPPPRRLDVPPALLVAGLGLLAAGALFAVRRLGGRREARRGAQEPREVEVVPVRDDGEGHVVSSGGLLTGFELRASTDPGIQEIRKDGPLVAEGGPRWS